MAYFYCNIYLKSNKYHFEDILSTSNITFECVGRCREFTYFQTVGLHRGFTPLQF